jgi:hypothetical protein
MVPLQGISIISLIKTVTEERHGYSDNSDYRRSCNMPSIIMKGRDKASTLSVKFERVVNSNIV